MSTRGFAALRVPKFRFYLAGSVFSRIADNMEQVVRNWLVWQLTGSPFWLGVMLFCHWFPMISLSIFSGVLADRVDNRKLILICEFNYFLTSLMMGILVVTGLINLWQIIVLLLLHGLSASIGQPSRQVFIHDTVGKDKLISAVSLTNSLFNCMQFVGPAIAGVLIAVVGPGLTYFANAAMFAPAVIVMAIIRVPKRHRQTGQASPWASTAEGLRYVRANPLLTSLLALATVPAILIGDGISAMMPIFATEILHVGAEGMGFLLSANGFGAISAALFISYMGGVRRKGSMVILTSFLFGAFLVAFSLSSWYFLSILILVCLGMSAVASQTVINTSLQLGAPDDMRGRVMGLYSLGTLGVRAFNGPLIGVFASAVGAPLAMGSLGALVSIAVIVIAVLTPQRRTLN